MKSKGTLSAEDCSPIDLEYVRENSFSKEFGLNKKKTEKARDSSFDIKIQEKTKRPSYFQERSKTIMRNRLASANNVPQEINNETYAFPSNRPPTTDHQIRATSCPRGYNAIRIRTPSKESSVKQPRSTNYLPKLHDRPKTSVQIAQMDYSTNQSMLESNPVGTKLQPKHFYHQYLRTTFNTSLINNNECSKSDHDNDTLNINLYSPAKRKCTYDTIGKRFDYLVFTGVDVFYVLAKQVSLKKFKKSILRLNFRKITWQMNYFH